MAEIADKRGFIAANTALLPVPLTPSVTLHLADDETPLWRMGEEELADLGLPFPFWAFAWAGGQALARYCLDNPALLANKSVFDFASGSGLVAIAAAMAGAGPVTASDIDPFAVEAIALNATQNAVHVSTSAENWLAPANRDRLIANPPDLLLAGDVFYDAAMTRDVLALFKPLAAIGTNILVGDPSRAYLPKDCLVPLAHYRVPVTRALEDYEIRSTRVWQFALD